MATKYKNTAASALVKTGFGRLYGLFCSASSSLVAELVDGIYDNDDAADAATGTLTSTGEATPASHATSEIVSSGACAPADYARNTLTITGAISDGETVVIGAITYRFKNTTAQAYDVKIGASDAITLDNLKLAINGTGVGDGTDYHAGTIAHTLVIAHTNTDTTQQVWSRTIGTGNNALGTTETMANGSWADTTLGGGTGVSEPGVATTNATIVIGSVTYTAVLTLAETFGLSAVANQVLWETSEAVFLDNLKLAINAGSGAGTKYGTGTTAHARVIATTNTNTVQTIVARVIGTTDNTLATTTTLANYAWADTTLGGGTGNSNPGVASTNATVTIDGRVYTFVQELSETSGAAAVVDQILYGANAAAALDNLKSAINASAGAGTTYSTGTTAHSTVNATTNTDTTQVIEADTAGTAGNAITTTETLANFAWGGATLSGGLEAQSIIIEEFTLTAGETYNFSPSGQGISFETGLYFRIKSGTGEVTIEYE